MLLALHGTPTLLFILATSSCKLLAMGPIPSGSCLPPLYVFFIFSPPTTSSHYPLTQGFYPVIITPLPPSPKPYGLADLPHPFNHCPPPLFFKSTINVACSTTLLDLRLFCFYILHQTSFHGKPWEPPDPIPYGAPFSSTLSGFHVGTVSSTQEAAGSLPPHSLQFSAPCTSPNHTKPHNRAPPLADTAHETAAPSLYVCCPCSSAPSWIHSHKTPPSWLVPCVAGGPSIGWEVLGYPLWAVPIAQWKVNHGGNS